MHYPLISVIIVTYNRENELKRALDSVVKQTYPNFEIIVINNGSTDGTVSMLKSKYKMVKVVNEKQNLGCPLGRNIGINRAKGSLLFFLDDDAWCDSNYLLQAFERLMSERQNVKILMPQILELIDNEWKPRFLNKEARYMASFSGGVSLIKREVFDELGLFEDTHYGAEEKYLAIEMFIRKYKILLEPKLKIFHQPSFQRDPYKLFSLKVENDFAWTVQITPFWLTFPSLMVKTFQWVKDGLKKKLILSAILGCLKGWLNVFNFSKKENKRLTTSNYLAYIAFRKKTADNS